MPSLKILKSFSFAERGIDVIDYAEGDTVEVSDDCAEVALAEGWAEPAQEATGKRGKKRVEAEPLVDQDFESHAAE